MWHVTATGLASPGPHMEQGRGRAAPAAVSLGRGSACLFVLPIVCAQEPHKKLQGSAGESSVSHGHIRQPWGCCTRALLASDGQERLLWNAIPCWM